jgi:hypothetical protein
MAFFVSGRECRTAYFTGPKSIKEYWLVFESFVDPSIH